MGLIMNKKGFTITEIVVATVIFVGLFTTLSLYLNSSRTETSKSINYMRAMQLAQETIDWVNSTPYEKIDNSPLSILNGSLVDAYTKKSVPIPVGENANNTVTNPEYPEDYTKCYYYRTIKVDKLDSLPNGRFLKKVTVSVYWNESKVPKSLVTATSGEPDRMRKIVLSTLVFDEKAYY
jgi:type II secretory pathway pseudopilin PulG